jgi:hypothetical protein
LTRQAAAWAKSASSGCIAMPCLRDGTDGAMGIERDGPAGCTGSMTARSGAVGVGQGEKRRKRPSSLAGTALWPSTRFADGGNMATDELAGASV